MSVPSADELKQLVPMLAPGLVILGVRQCFMASPTPRLEDRLVSYASLSVLYYAAASVVLGLFDLRNFLPWVVQLLEYVVIPALLGVAFGICARLDALDWLWGLIKVRPVHHAPTAWDWKFSRIKEGAFILVTLSDGSTVAGQYGEGAFSSSNESERDLILSRVYDCAGGGPWVELNPPRSILLCGRDIRFVEFF